MTRSVRAHLTPIAVDFERRVVGLVDLGGAVLAEPFFADTIERIVRERPDVERALLGFREVVASGASNGAQPDGFVFHSGRCGSTLLSKMLADEDHVAVVREPQVLNDVLAALVGATGSDRAELLQLMRAVVRLLSGSQQTSHRVIKLCAWNVQCAGELAQALPGTRALFLYRSPFETVASLLADPPGWSQLIDAPRTLQARFFPSIAGVEADEPMTRSLLYAHAWRSTCEAAMASDRMLFVDYDSLVSQPKELLAFLGQAWELPVESQVDRLASTMAVYSKDVSAQASYDPLGAHERPALTAQDHRQVAEVVGDLPIQLRDICWSS